MGTRQTRVSSVVISREGVSLCEADRTPSSLESMTSKKTQAKSPQDRTVNTPKGEISKRHETVDALKAEIARLQAEYTAFKAKTKEQDTPSKQHFSGASIMSWKHRSMKAAEYHALDGKENSKLDGHRVLLLIRPAGIQLKLVAESDRSHLIQPALVVVEHGEWKKEDDDKKWEAYFAQEGQISDVDTSISDRDKGEQRAEKMQQLRRDRDSREKEREEKEREERREIEEEIEEGRKKRGRSREKEEYY
ncbi:hypothetical protein BO71DRAFT_433671 [Aspergillus ellipticus CBS 707.79]|uniref:Uncharacterized protein n=1 Tax=Aspergillus ellipticus CBS 707.79 TaxID=1448320 RepID=A0A319D0V6_9EURO|nr:hypothetical protein BO71DRAFT_433671 [Aspergillus ellipticus CBS 707.79]